MLDIGWTELFVVGIVALIVIGPKDLPGALNTFGKYVGQLRRMVRQFQDGVEDIAHQEELRELRKSITEVVDTGNLDRHLNSDIDGAAQPAEKAALADSADANSIAPPYSIAPPEPMPEPSPDEPAAAIGEPGATEPGAVADDAKPSSTTASS